VAWSSSRVIMVKQLSWAYKRKKVCICAVTSTLQWFFPMNNVITYHCCFCPFVLSFVPVCFAREITNDQENLVQKWKTQNGVYLGKMRTSTNDSVYIFGKVLKLWITHKLTGGCIWITFRSTTITSNIWQI